MVNFFANSGFKLSSMVSVRPNSFHPPRSSAVNMTTNGSDFENVSALRRFLHETTNSTFELSQIFTFQSLSNLSLKDSGFWRVWIVKSNAKSRHNLHADQHIICCIYFQRFYLLFTRSVWNGPFQWIFQKSYIQTSAPW